MSYQDQLGRKGEKAVYNYLISHNYDVQNVSSDPCYWPKDIDFLATKDGKTTSIEVKNCQCIGRTGNLFVEHTQDIDSGEPGWFLITEAQQLFYRDDINGIVYVIDMNDLREYIQAKKGVLPERKAKPNAVGKVSEGYLVKVQELSTIYPVVQFRA